MNLNVTGIYEDINEAIRVSKEAQKTVREMSLAQREKIISKIRENICKYAEELSALAVKETGMGRIDDKIFKHELVAKGTPGTEDIKAEIISGDNGFTIFNKRAFGVIGAITPCTNPSCTILNNSIAMIAAGNTVVFNPHPNAVKVSNRAVEIVNISSVEGGGPENIVTSVTNPTIESGNVLMKHPDISLLAVTGGPGVVTAALCSGKRAIGAGAGNPPVVVDETADIIKAAIDIVDGCTFDNNLPCISEKEVVVVKEVADELIHHMIKNGCYMLNGEQVERLTRLVLLEKNGRVSLNRDFVGKDAVKILEAIDIKVIEPVRCIIFKAEKEHPLVVQELMMPVLGIVEVKDINEAVLVAKELEHGNRHSAHIHSKNIDNLNKYEKEMDTTILVKNAPSYSALGVGGEGFATFTIASRTGEGLTSPKTFTKNTQSILKTN